MDKLWLSADEKKRYQKIYSKLQQNNYLSKDKLIKFITSRAQISSSQAKEIVGKGFLVSKESNQMDLTGLFYLMKYVALIQNGGSETDEITQIQKELPLAHLKESKKGSDSQEKSGSIHQKDELKQKDHNLNNIEDLEENKQNIDNQSNGRKVSELISKSVKENSQEIVEQEEKKIDKQIELNNSFLHQSNVSVNDMNFSSFQSSQNNLKDQAVLNQVGKNSNSPVNIQENEQNQKKQDGEHEEQEEQKEVNQQDYNKKNANQQGQQNINLNYNIRDCRLLTFGKEQAEDLKSILKEMKENEQQVNNNKHENGDFSINQDKNALQKDKDQSFINQNGISKVKLNDQKSQPESFSAIQEKENEQRENISEVKQFDIFSNQNLPQQPQIYFEFNQEPDIYSEHNDGNVNSVYEQKEQPQQPFFEQKAFQNTEKVQKQSIEENQQRFIIEDQKQKELDDEDQKLIKSVSQVFQKDDQKQIQHAFDFFKSNREDNILNKSKVKKEKNIKRVKITGHRNEYENYIKQYTLYYIETTVDGRKITVERRYNNFRALHEYFENSVDYYGIIKPILPSTNMTSIAIGQYIGKQEQQQLDQRQIDLENYLNLYLQNEILRHDKVLTSFLEEKQFIPPADTQFSYVEWVKKMVANVQDTDFSEWRDYTEAKMKITLNEFFKLGDNEVDTSDVDSKMEQVNQLGQQVNKIIEFLNNDIKYDNEQLNAIEQLERNFYSENDLREQPQNDTLLEILKNFKSEILDHQNKVKVEIQEKHKVLQEFRIIHNFIESAKVAQQVLKNKIQERYILKNMKVSKFNKVHEQNNNRSDSSEAKRELEKLNEKFQQSEDTIKQIQLKLSKELLTFIEIQRQKISDALKLFSDMNKQIYVQLNK
ncbi:PX domain protein (macronuclear) [Tetrahymena thermophila SB210]|uniref:PX domain protein n=1 Tax=Tetrahymena thermophila (strain SB210) TaxID=312017 RepID=I7MDS2_TETTS|nr:PX domain protein [Tetrahymena thermophila SB210]EAR90849.2 PX domain protein [Tetrahymena thermophila SB210]|eukprot:XP_001011094.2 PX domain protein [Tetrahymena thermophila SB210]